MFEAPARPVIPEMPERDTRDEIRLQAVATEDSTTASSESTTPAASCCSGIVYVVQYAQSRRGNTLTANISQLAKTSSRPY